MTAYGSGQNWLSWHRAKVAFGWCIPLLALVAITDAAALSCPEYDPYELVESAYNESDLVFIGSVEGDSPFKNHVPSITVEAKWKGPEVLSIAMLLNPWRPRDREVFFAARSDQPSGWSDRYPECFPNSNDLTVRDVLVDVLGKPVPPSQSANSRMQITYIGILLAALGGVGLFAWSLRSN